MPIRAEFSLPFAEQLDFFRRKLNLPSERWDDIWQAAHDRAFVVAGAMKADLLDDLRSAVGKAVAEGTALAQFRKDFRTIVARHGWTGWTGEGTRGGEAWRTRIIYETNLRTSHAAGRWRQLTDPELLAHRPYWRYVHSDSVLHPRPHHKRWGDLRLTLRHDHPFWRTHFPPNGWGCRCRVVAVTGPREGDATEPPAGWDARSEKTGAPLGIDRGWAYAPGEGADTALRQSVQDKLITWPPAITKALSKDVNRYINASDAPERFVREVLSDPARAEPLWLGFVEKPEQLAELAAQDLTGYLLLVPADTPRHVEKAHRFDGKGQRPATPEDYRRLAQLFAGDAEIVSGHDSPDGFKRIRVTRMIDGERFRSVWEVRPGRRNRAVVLVSLVIGTQ